MRASHRVMFLRKSEKCHGELSGQALRCHDQVLTQRPSAKIIPATIIGILAVCVLAGLLWVALTTKRKAPAATPEVAEVVNPELIRAKAVQGEAEAQKELGNCYARGQGVKLDYKEAAKWYQLAADQGNAGAQNALGELYEAGQGVSRSETEAAKWYRRAAEQGHAAGQYGLAVMYLTGSGVPKDDAEALKWYRQAADQGYALAIFHLGMRYKKGQGVPPDPAEAYKWLDLAAARGIAEANEIRDELKRSMTREQIAEGKRRAEAFVPKKHPTPTPVKG